MASSLLLLVSWGFGGLKWWNTQKKREPFALACGENKKQKVIYIYIHICIHITYSLYIYWEANCPSQNAGSWLGDGLGYNSLYLKSMCARFFQRWNTQVPRSFPSTWLPPHWFVSATSSASQSVGSPDSLLWLAAGAGGRKSSSKRYVGTVDLQWSREFTSLP